MEILVIGLACLFGGYMAWNIGANDVANAMGTSVGSRALTMKQAIIAAAIADFAGAVLVGGHVSDTIRKGMIHTDMFTQDPHQIMLGMLGALLAAGLWIQFASWLRVPISTTQSVIGGVIGFALFAIGIEAVQWAKLSQIVLSWVICPTMSGLGAYILATLIRTRIINARDPVGATRGWTPILVFTVFMTLCLVILFKGLKNLHLDLPLEQAVIISCLVGGLAAVFGWILVGRAEPTDEDREVIAEARQQRQRVHLAESLQRALAALKSTDEEAVCGQTAPEKVEEAAGMVEALLDEIHRDEDTRRDPDLSYRFVERVFSSLQVISACCVAFAHGSNDVGNAVGPLAAVVNAAQTGSVAAEVPVPFWTLLLGGVFIAIGVATWGPRVMVTVGERITHLTPTRGFAAEFSTAATVVLASRMGLPVSTTHVIVGAVVGVGFARGVGRIDWRVMGKMALMWLLEVPVVALLSGIIFLILRAIL